MNYKTKPKINETRKDGENKLYSAKKLIKVINKELENDTFKYIDLKIEMNLEFIKIHFFKRKKEKLLSSLSVKHMILNRAVDDNVPRIDSCRLFGDPIFQNTILSFSNPGIANNFEFEIKKQREIYDKIYGNISYSVNVINKVNETMKESASVFLSGLTTGKQLKQWIEKEFNFKEIHMPKYVIQLYVHNNYEIIQDDISILILYEHMISYGLHNMCGKDCFLPIKKPAKPVSIYIYLNAPDNQHKEENDLEKYCIEEKWCGRVIPDWLMRLLSDLYYQGPLELGVFRICGSYSLLAKYYKLMLEFNDFVITENIYNKASILKYFLRHIEGSLMTKKTRLKLNALCKKIIKITAEEFLKNEKIKNKLIKLIQSLPQTNLSLLQHILVILKAFTESSVTLCNELTVAITIAPSIFPCIHAAYCNYSPKLLAACLLLIDSLISEDVKKEILSNFRRFNMNTTKQMNETPEFLSTAEGSLVRGSHKSEKSEKESDSESSIDDPLSDDRGSSNDFFSASDNEDQISSKSESLFISDTNAMITENVPAPDIPSTSDLKINNSFDGRDKLISSTEASRGKENYQCNLKRNRTLYTAAYDSSQTNPHRMSSRRSSNSEVKTTPIAELRPIVRRRSVNVPCFTDSFPNSRGDTDSNKSNTDIVLRAASRRALSIVAESCNMGVSEHRSRSPNVKSLIRMYENKSWPSRIKSTVNNDKTVKIDRSKSE